LYAAEYLKPKQLIIKDCARHFVLKLYRHEASLGLLATAELLVVRDKKQNAIKQMLIVCKYMISGCDDVFVCSAIPGYAGAAAQATFVQPGQTAFVAAAPQPPTYETYQTSQTAAPQYAFAARSQV